MSVDDPEPILDPGLPIVDAHHHLWDFRPPPSREPPSPDPFVRTLALTPRYLVEELAADAGCGHDVRATVFVECRAMYRADGPEPMRPVGETEFVAGVAAMSASGGYGLRADRGGDRRPCGPAAGRGGRAPCWRRTWSRAAVASAACATRAPGTPTPRCWAC